MHLLRVKISLAGKARRSVTSIVFCIERDKYIRVSLLPTVREAFVNVSIS